MKKFSTLRAIALWSKPFLICTVLSLLGVLPGRVIAQNFSATGNSGTVNMAIPDNDAVTGVTSTVSLSGGIGNVGPNTKLSVTLNITHTYDADLDIFLVGPGGCGTLELITDVGAAVANFTNTVLASPNGGGSITGGTAPFTGTFSPEGDMTGTQVVAPYSLSTTSITGCPVNGTWTLRIFDDAGLDTGTLVSWSLTVANADKLVAWQLSMPVAAGNEATYAATTLRTGLNASSLTRGAGINAAALVRTFNSDGFNTAPNTEAAAITSGDYYQFTVGASAGFQVSLSTLDARLRRTATGPNTYQWRYSLNGTTFVDIGGDVTYSLTTGTGDDQTQVNLSGIGALQNVAAGTTITLRIYMFGGTTNAAGAFAIGRFAGGDNSYSLSVGGTLVPTTPLLSPTTPTGFSNVCINTTGGPNTFTINGTFLTAANVTVGALTGFEYSYQGAGGPYNPSLSLTQPGGTYSQVIHVRFNPTLVQSYNGNIAVGGGGASSVNVAVTGSGVNTVPSLTSGAASSITTGGAVVAGTITSNGCSAPSSYGIEYSTTNGFVSGTQVASTNISGGNYTSTLTGLLSCTTYYYKAYAINGGGTGYGTQGSFTTAAPVAPAAQAANPVSYDSFTANWNAATDAASYQLDVSTSPTLTQAVPATLVQWNFPNAVDDAVADGGITTNLAKTITTVGGTNALDFSVAGATTRCVATDGWDGGNGVKYWQVDFSTQGYTGITVSSKQRSSNTGPRDFRLEYRIGTGGTWTVVAGGSVTVLNDAFVNGVLSNVVLPSACDDQPSVYLRWIITSDFRVSGVTPIAANGTSRIDDISIAAANSPFLLAGYNPLGVAGTSQSVTGLNPSTTYYYRVRSVGNGGCVSGNSSIISVTTSAVPTYYSRATGNVTDPIWSPVPSGLPGAGPATFTANSSMVVQSPDVVTNTANATIKNLTIDAGGTLVLNGSTTLDVKGTTATITGTLTANDNSTLSITEATNSALAITGTASFYDLTTAPAGTITVTGTAEIRNTLQLNDGVFDATGGLVILHSTATYTGRLGPVGATASYSGNVRLERYVPGGATNWRLLGSPLATRTVTHWQDDFITAGYPGSQFPNFDDPPGSNILWPSVRWYDESNTGTQMNDGLVGVSSNTQPLSQGQGFAAWSGDNLGGTAPFVVDLTGNPYVANTPIALPVTWTNTSTPTVDGWNLVSNPVASPILFSSINRGADVADFVTFYNPAAGNTAVYDISLGFGTNGATNTIQSSQGFFLKATGAGVTTTVSESAKTTGNGGGFFGGDEEPVASALRLKVTSAINAYNDEAVVLFSSGTPAVDGEDALKYVFAIPGAPQIATIGGGNELIAINAYGAYTTDISIPVMVDAGVSGTYTVTATGISTLGLTCVSIEDLLTGTITPLIEGASYSFEMEADADASVPRLLLHATAPLPFTAQDATCGGEANGQATVTVTQGPVDVTWTDAVGGVLLEQNGISGDATFGGLAAGSYMVHVSTGSVCGELVNEFTINAPFVLEGATVGNSPATCADTEDGSIDVMVMGGVEPYSYTWSNGAGTEDLTAGAGNYTLTVTDANNCVWNSDVLTIAAGGPTAGFTVENATVLVNADVVFTNTSTAGESYFWTFGDGGTSTEADPTYAYTLPGTWTVTLTVTSGDCIAVSTLEVTVELNTGVATNPLLGLNAWTSPNGFVVEHNFTEHPVQIDVLDATGRLVMQRQVPGTPGRVVLPTEGMSTGIWFVRVSSGPTQQTFRLPLLR